MSRYSTTGTSVLALKNSCFRWAGSSAPDLTAAWAFSPRTKSGEWTAQETVVDVGWVPRPLGGGGGRGALVQHDIWSPQFVFCRECKDVYHTGACSRQVPAAVSIQQVDIAVIEGVGLLI